MSIFKNTRKKTNRIIWSQSLQSFITYKGFFFKRKIVFNFHERDFNIISDLISNSIFNKIHYTTKKKKGYKKAVHEETVSDWGQLESYKLVEFKHKSLHLCRRDLKRVFGHVPSVIFYKVEKGKDESK